MTRVALLLALCGCDKLFDLDRLPGGDVDSGVSPNADATGLGDAGPCMPVGHDEDGDGLDDACDGCPTVVSDKRDDDGDGLPNACDHNEAANGDRILFYRTFATQADLNDLVTENAAYSMGNNGYVTLAGLGSLTTAASYLPTRIELHLDGIIGTGGTSELRIELPTGVTCRVQGSNCAGNTNTNTCITLQPSGGNSDWPFINASVRRLSLFRDSMMRCQVSDASTGGATAIAQQTFTNSGLAIKTTAAANVDIEAIVIYGSK